MIRWRPAVTSPVRQLAGVIVAVLLLCAACGSAARVAGPPQLPTTSVAPPSSALPKPNPDPVTAAVVAAYNGMWADEQVAALTSDWQSPLLAQHASGAALSLLVRGLYSYRMQHLVIKGQPVTHPAISALTPTCAPRRATVRDCFDDTHWLVYKAAGGLKNNVPGGHGRVTAVLSQLNGTWKVTELTTAAAGTC